VPTNPGPLEPEIIDKIRRGLVAFGAEHKVIAARRLLICGGFRFLGFRAIIRQLSGLVREVRTVLVFGIAGSQEPSSVTAVKNPVWGLNEPRFVNI
jgi:hypothetical protein